MQSARQTRETAAPVQATIMLLEPEIIARMALGEYLRQCGYRVIEGYRPEEVFLVLEAGTSIDIVLTQVRLGNDLDGVALAKRLRESHPHIEVLVVVGTAHAADRAAKLCDIGPRARPYHPRDLLRRIHLLREKRRAQTEEIP